MADLDDKTTTYDSQQLAEEISEDKEKAPQVNVEADYARSKEFDVAEIDRTGEGAKAAEKATSSKPSSGAGSEQAEGDPDAFRKLAKDVTHSEDK